jgi:hypothetical protein
MDDVTVLAAEEQLEPEVDVLKNFEEDLVVCINLLAEKEVDLEDIEVLEKYGPDDLVVPAPFWDLEQLTHQVNDFKVGALLVSKEDH